VQPALDAAAEAQLNTTDRLMFNVQHSAFPPELGHPDALLRYDEAFQGGVWVTVVVVVTVVVRDVVETTVVVLIEEVVSVMVSVAVDVKVVVAGAVRRELIWALRLEIDLSWFKSAFDVL
jgi:hypothetical protein